MYVPLQNHTAGGSKSMRQPDPLDDENSTASEGQHGLYIDETSFRTGRYENV